MEGRKRDKSGRFIRQNRPDDELELANAEAVEDGPQAEKVRPRFCRVYVRDQMAAKLPKIVRALIAKALQGSVPHIALMLKTAGLDQKGPLVVPLRRREKGLEQILLEQWEADRVRNEAEAAAQAALD